MENQLFDLKKIREITSPIENLQGKVNQLANLVNQFESEKLKISQYSDNEFLLTQITDLTPVLESINKKLKKIFTNNINKFLNLNHKLTIKYKTNLKNTLKLFDLNEDNTITVGQSLIEKRKISKIITQVSYTPSISIKQWLELIDALNENTVFLSSAEKLQKSYLKIVKKRLEYELKKIPFETPSSIIEEFEKQFNTNHDLTYEKFLKTIKSKLTEEELQIKKELLAKSKQKQEIEELKKTQEEQTETFESYLKLSEKEFERKLRKRKREKLIDVKESENQKKLELSDEISEKIEKFKMKFDKKSDENYLAKENIDEDPLEIIRERKKKKEKEYKKFKDHFESD
ncbi:MAG: hypothetical protein HWN80_10825 [Candidatus Lokiarchaeota archaeon]|nr:hypothetical protein [Candidatus Lokiarchaeota archaeon]